MTLMIPENCVDTKPAAQKLHQCLYDQLGPDYKIIQRIKPTQQACNINTSILNGSIFWIQYKSQSLFIYLSDTPADYFSKLEKSNPESIKKRLFNHTELIALLRFQNSLLPSLLQPHKARLTPFLMFFSNIDAKEVNIGIKSLGLYLLGKDKLASNKLQKLIDKFMGESLSNTSRHHLRSIFNPELTIYSHQINNCLLDNEQEIAIKNDIRLSDTQNRDKHLNLRGVNGPLNSGKTEVILQRAKLFNQTSSETKVDKHILILTPDKVSQLSLHNRYHSLHPADKKTEILSLYQWCSQLLNSSKKLVNREQILDLIDQKISHNLYENHINITLFFQEIDFILGRTLMKKKDYLKATRDFQISNLDDNQHKIIWNSLEKIKTELSLSNTLLDTELPQLLWASLQIKPTDELYDHILLDDAHLFPPIVFELIKKLIKPKTGQLFITQNPNQLLLNSCRLWQETGLELRGHSTRLLNNYDINPYILNAASSFYLHRLPDDSDKKIYRDLPDILTNPMPTLLHFHSHADEDNRLLSRVRTLLSNGASPEEILLVSINPSLIPHYENMFKQTLNIPTCLLTGENKSQNGIGICSLSYAHGQKASYVLILGIGHMYEEECGLKSNECIALHKDNTKKLTVAMTCAKQELTLFLTSKSIPRDFINPHIDIPNMSSNTYADVHALHA